jgi:hypothetical protein
MKVTPRLGRVSGALAISLGLSLAVVAAAQANSIVYLKSGTSGSRHPTAHRATS